MPLHSHRSWLTQAPTLGIELKVENEVKGAKVTHTEQTIVCSAVLVEVATLELVDRR